MEWLAFLLRWLHVLSALVLAGFLLWVNLVQIPVFATLEPPERVRIAATIGRKVLAWMQGSGLLVIITGLGLAAANGNLAASLSLGVAGGGVRDTLLGLGMWTGMIMVAILWFAIAPIMARFADADTPAEARPGLAKRAIRLARLNLALLIPLTFVMVGYQNLP